MGKLTISMAMFNSKLLQFTRGYMFNRPKNGENEFVHIPLQLSYTLMDLSKASMGKSPFLMGKLTISMAIFNSFLYVYQVGYHLIHSQRSSLDPEKPPRRYRAPPEDIPPHWATRQRRRGHPPRPPATAIGETKGTNHDPNKNGAVG